MTRTFKTAFAAAAALLITGAAVDNALAQGKGCVRKHASTSSGSESFSKFMVDETLIQAVSIPAWVAFVATGQTPGYKMGPRKYKCSTKSGEVTCFGSATICPE